MPEGDTLARIAEVLSRVLVGQEITSARGRSAAQLGRLAGQRVESVASRGKHLLIGFSNGLTLHTHLGLHGSWHRYRAGEAWHRPSSRAVAVLEAQTVVAVCFDAPTVEVVETRTLAIHPRLARLGADIAAVEFNVETALTALRHPRLAAQPIGDALLDQRAVAGLGNVYRSELCFLVRINPFTPVWEVDDVTLGAVLRRAARLVAANSRGGPRVTTDPGTPGTLYVYGRAGRPCRRCGTIILSAVSSAGARGNPRRVYWCPRCQPLAAGAGSDRSQSRENRGGQGLDQSQGTAAHSRSR